MAHALLLSFRDGITLVEDGAAPATVETAQGKLPLPHLTEGLLAALRALASGGATEGALSDLVLETDGPSALPLLYYYLGRFGEWALLRHTLLVDGQPLATAIPMVRGCQLGSAPVALDAPWRLSRFAYLRREGEALVLESPLSVVRTLLHGPTAAALVGALTRPRTARDLAARTAGVAADALQAFLGLLASAGVIAEPDAEGRLPEETDPTLAQWEFHDLLFHSRSRPGRHDYPTGGTYRFLGKLPPLPALKPRMCDAVVPLYRPDLARLAPEDPPLTGVLERRRSIREYGDPPMTTRQLGEFLYRVARVRQLTDADPARGVLYQVSSRPYPSGGATYELELYVAVNTCEGLAPGLYHYDPLAHELCKLADRNAHVEALLRDAQRAAALRQPPQVLLTLASRFQRRSWKYAAIAYANSLKNVGVLYQTMYLAATAMGLAPCGVGCGNADTFARAAGTVYFAESSVGEFLLGSKPRGG
jgi:SagB-type dehydrogenase family enzyme